MTRCSHAAAGAWFNYPFLTSKERDIETGLDYFLARYYSSMQGRFTSPDEFTGGPDELYNFVVDASENPTFYADFTNPQSLNKYQYVYNNPLKYTDDDGHCGALCLRLAAAGASAAARTPAGQRLIHAAGAAATTTIVVASGALQKLGTAFMEASKGTTPVPGCLAGSCGSINFNKNNTAPTEVTIDGSKHPEAARHAEDAQKAGQPDTLTVDRGGAKDRRREATSGTTPTKGKDRDEYPPAVTKEGGKGASVRPISPKDNRGAGASIGNQIKKVPDGGKIKIKIELF